jgi:hypothetical protein
MKNPSLRYWLLSAICVAIGVAALYLAPRVPTVQAQEGAGEPTPMTEGGCGGS